LSPAFASATFVYYVSLSNTQTTVKLTPSSTSSFATIQVAGVSVSSGSQSSNIVLSVGNTTVSIAVTAQDTTTITTYTVVVNRAPCN